MADAPTLRDRARDAVREEVSLRAWELFATRGFEATTVDEIAAAAGMSRRTFFRYFEGKDALVLERLAVWGDRIADDLRGRPADEPAWPALRAAFAGMVEAAEAEEDRTRRLLQLLREERTARVSLLERRMRWHVLLAPLVLERLRRADPTATETAASALTAGALSCLDVAQDAWGQQEGADLGALLDEAMGALGPLGGGLDRPH